jgi:exonuclease VII large subunit
LHHKLGQRMHYLLLDSRHRLRELGIHRALRQLEDLLRRRRQLTDELGSELGEGLRARLDRSRRRLSTLAHRLASVDLRARLGVVVRRLEQRSSSIGVRMDRLLAAKHRHVERLRLQLEERSPLAVLSRGYAVCYDAAGNVVHAANDVGVGERIRVQLSRGRLGAEVRDREVPDEFPDKARHHGESHEGTDDVS